MVVLTMAKGGVIEDTIAELISLSLSLHITFRRWWRYSLFEASLLKIYRPEEMMRRRRKKERYYQAFKLPSCPVQ